MPYRIVWTVAALCIMTGMEISAFAAAPVTPPPGGEPVFTSTDWPWWRGPNRDGVAPAGQTIPLVWSETENVIWKAPVPGKGHGSPTVVGDRVFLATADGERQEQSVLCFERATGKLAWQTVVHRGPLETKGNGKSSQASVSVACDGESVYVNFLHDGSIYATALTVDGKQRWQKKITDFVMHQGFGSSPAVYGPLVIVSADHKGGGAVTALERATGNVAWSIERPKLPNYTSPIIVSVAGKDQLVLTGCDLVTSLDPLTGKTLWEIAGATTECVTSTVTDGTRIFTSGGYPKNHLSAVSADGSGKVEWENPSRVYVPSLIAHGGHLYGVLDAGVAVCWESATGKEVWKNRIGGTFSGSPVLVGDLLLATDEAGKTSIWKATPTEFELVGQNQLGDEAFATPVVCGNRIYLRAATTIDGKRQETLYCIGKD